MADTKISGLGAGTPKSTDLFVAVDTTDASMAPTGTDKKYTRSGDAAYVVGTITLAGDVTGPVATTAIAANAVTNAKMAAMPAHTIKGNNAGSSGDPVDLTIAQVKTDLAYGTMADQDASALAITGGTIAGTAITTSSLSATSIAEPSFSVAGVIHNNSSGVFSSSLVVDADVTAATITNAKLATMAAHTFKGNNTGSSAVPLDLTIAQMQAELGAGASTPLTATQIGFGSGTNTLTGLSTFTYNSATVTLGLTAANSQIGMGTSSSQRKITLYQNSGNNIQFTGFGADGTNLTCNIVSSAAAVKFFAGVNSTTQTNIFNINGTGVLTVPSLTTPGVIHNDSSGNFSSSLIVAADITTATITNAKLANMPTLTIKGNNTGGSAAPLDLTVAQVNAMLGAGSSTPLTQNQIAFGSASNTLTSSADLTWNGTTFTADGAAVINSSLQAAVTATGSNAYISVGSGGNLGTIFARANSGGEWFSGSVAGDGIIRNGDTAKSILIGVGTGTAEINVSNGGVQLNGGTRSASSTFTVFSTTQGTQPNPSMTTTQRNAISSPATNLQVFDTTLGQGMFYDGANWMIMY